VPTPFKQRAAQSLLLKNRGYGAPRDATSLSAVYPVGVHVSSRSAPFRRFVSAGRAFRGCDPKASSPVSRAPGRRAYSRRAVPHIVPDRGCEPQAETPAASRNPRRLMNAPSMETANRNIVILLKMSRMVFAKCKLLSWPDLFRPSRYEVWCLAKRDRRDKPGDDICMYPSLAFAGTTSFQSGNLPPCFSVSSTTFERTRSTDSCGSSTWFTRRPSAAKSSTTTFMR
jgi:hypothetical protein